MPNTYLSMHSATGVSFKDLGALNDELRAGTHVGELLDSEGVPKGSGFLEVSGQRVRFMDREAGEHEDTANVGDCWSSNCFKIIGKHLSSGKLTLALRAEADEEPDYWLITPGKAKLTQPRF